MSTNVITGNPGLNHPAQDAVIAAEAKLAQDEAKAAAEAAAAVAVEQTQADHAALIAAENAAAQA